MMVFSFPQKNKWMLQLTLRGGHRPTRQSSGSSSPPARGQAQARSAARDDGGEIFLKIAVNQVRTLTLIAILGCFILGITGCASDTTPQEEAGRPAEDLYTQAQTQLEGKDYKNAAHLFDEVERQHPYSPWAARAQLMAAYASYKAMKYDDAILALERFIELHPGHQDVAYAYYLRAMCYYEQISDVGRDQKMTRMAMESLQQIVQRFPETSYARDAKLKLDLTVDHLAGKEMEIGRYYLRRHIYNGAINRFRVVIEKYQTTSHVPEALHRLVEAYLSLGLKSEAQSAAAVLGHNFPGSSWYVDSYALLVDASVRPKLDKRSWLAKFWNGF